ncbi:MAG TPA: TRAP transporter small permease, partial [Paracoccus sp.]|nr:TRAP transporter small permease [Paracoccus sp. (in: a-proteobacteria)]
FLVMPWFALTMSLHAMINLAEDIGLLEPRQSAQDITHSEG